MYETPKISELGSVADFTRGAGAGSESDGLYDFIEVIFPGSTGGLGKAS
jgi:hypothetical protein